MFTVLFHMQASKVINPSFINIVNSPFIIVNIAEKQMESLNSCPDFFRKGNGARLSHRHDHRYQMAVSVTPKSELFNF
jgi:hypothetical protein